MKKLKSLGVGAAATILLTSCLDGNNEQTFTSFGVIDFSMEAGLVAYTDDYTPIYSPQFKDLQENGKRLRDATFVLQTVVFSFVIKKR